MMFLNIVLLSIALALGACAGSWDGVKRPHSEITVVVVDRVAPPPSAPAVKAPGAPPSGH
jgi:hypothetical protein